MERVFKLVIAYDGTDFHGWQAQPGLRTVQGELQQACTRLLRRPVELVGASRTDAGVHARGQAAHLRADCAIPAESLPRAIGARLPPDVAVLEARPVGPDFHATRSACAKLYRYTIYNSHRPPVERLLQRYAWHVWYPLELERMRAAAELLLGRHDFAGFANQGAVRESTVRTIHRVGIERHGEQVLIDVEGDGFLYNQVRVTVGTLVEVGRGHWPPERVAEILDRCDRRLAGPTAPAHGLCLQWVRYALNRKSDDGA